MASVRLVVPMAIAEPRTGGAAVDLGFVDDRPLAESTGYWREQAMRAVDREADGNTGSRAGTVASSAAYVCRRAIMRYSDRSGDACFVYLTSLNDDIPARHVEGHHDGRMQFQP